MDLTVVIPTRGGASIRSTLAALAAQQDPPLFEVIIAVDAAQAPDLTRVERHPRCSRIHLVVLGQALGVSAARNAAIAQARADLLAFLDDDVSPDPYWVATAVRALADWPAVTGRVLEDSTGSRLSVLRGLAFDQRHLANTSRPDQRVDYLNGGNCAMHADVLRKVGDFDLHYVKSQDRELARRILTAGLSIAYIPSLCVEHRSAYTVTSMLRGRYQAGRANAAMLSDGGTTSIGPDTLRDTYGAGLLTLARNYGAIVAGLAALSALAQKAGRLRRPSPTDDCT